MGHDLPNCFAHLKQPFLRENAQCKRWGQRVNQHKFKITAGRQLNKFMKVKKKLICFSLCKRKMMLLGLQKWKETLLTYRNRRLLSLEMDK